MSRQYELNISGVNFMLNPVAAYSCRRLTSYSQHVIKKKKAILMHLKESYSKESVAKNLMAYGLPNNDLPCWAFIYQ